MGYTFIGWYVGDSEYDWNTPIYSNITITAKFERELYILTYLTDENGIIYGETSQAVYYGQNGTQVTAIPNLDYEFVKWSDGYFLPSRTDVSVTRSKTVTAMFKQKEPSYEPKAFKLGESKLDSGDYYV